MKYKNVSRGIKKFRGVTFKPGEIKSVKGFINDPKMIRVDEPDLKAQSQPTKAASSGNSSSSTQKAADPKAEVKSNG